MGVGKGSGRGGARAGAGRKTLDGAVLVGSVTLTMDEDTERVAYELGSGNYSLGVRRAIAELLMYRGGGHSKRITHPAAAVTKPRSILRVPSTQEEDVPPRRQRGVIYDDE